MLKQPMKWNSNKLAYYGVTSRDETIRVDGDEYAEAQNDTPEDELENPDMWVELVGVNPNVEIVSAEEAI